MNTSGANTATVTLKEWIEGDRIPKELRDELQRILEVRFEGREDSDIVSTVSPPADLTKIWWPINATTGARQGNPKIWDTATSQWVDFGTLNAPVINYRQRRNGREQIPNGNGVAVVEFSSVGTLAYQIRLTPVFFADGVWRAVPANMNNFFIGIGAMNDTNFQIVFFTSPTGGMSVDWELSTTEGTADAIPTS